MGLVYARASYSLLMTSHGVSFPCFTLAFAFARVPRVLHYLQLVHALMAMAGEEGTGAGDGDGENAVVAAAASLPLISSLGASDLAFSSARRVKLGRSAREALCLRLTFVGELVSYRCTHRIKE